MNKFDVVIALEKLRDQKREWIEARRAFDVEYHKILNRLLLEGARAYMSVADLAKSSDHSRSFIRGRMKGLGLNQRDGLRLMAEHAAKALTENAELLGVDPHALLTSPLAYLPAGDELRKEMQAKNSVTELDPDVICTVPGCNCDIEYRTNKQ